MRYLLMTVVCSIILMSCSTTQPLQIAESNRIYSISDTSETQVDLVVLVNGKEVHRFENIKSKPCQCGPNDNYSFLNANRKLVTVTVPKEAQTYSFILVNR